MSNTAYMTLPTIHRRPFPGGDVLVCERFALGFVGRGSVGACEEALADGRGLHLLEEMGLAQRVGGGKEEGPLVVKHPISEFLASEPRLARSPVRPVVIARREDGRSLQGVEVIESALIDAAATDDAADAVGAVFGA